MGISQKHRNMPLGLKWNYNQANISRRAKIDVRQKMIFAVWEKLFISNLIEPPILSCLHDLAMENITLYYSNRSATSLSNLEKVG